MSHVMQPMSDKRHLERSIKLLFTLQTFLQIFTGISYPTGDIDECQNILMQVFVPVQAVQWFQEYINTFIFEFITPTGSDD